MNLIPPVSRHQISTGFYWSVCPALGLLRLPHCLATPWHDYLCLEGSVPPQPTWDPDLASVKGVHRII